MLTLINEARADAGLHALKNGPSGLQQTAALRAAELPHLFSHDRPTDDPYSRSWYNLLKGLLGDVNNTLSQTSGENVAGVAAKSTSYQDAFNAFWNSSGHRANIMSDCFTHVSIGVYSDGSKDWYAQEFIDLNWD